MGNRVISFQNGASEKKAYTYTYADVSMVADVKPTVIDHAARDVFSDFSTEMKLAKKTDVDAVKGAVRNIFSWVPGERIIQPEFGNTIRKLLYEGITNYNSEQIVNECKMLMTRWEPRAAIDRIFKKESTEETENNQITIILIWHVLGLPDQQYQTEVIF